MIRIVLKPSWAQRETSNLGIHVRVSCHDRIRIRRRIGNQVSQDVLTIRTNTCESQKTRLSGETRGEDGRELARKVE